MVLAGCHVDCAGGLFLALYVYKFRGCVGAWEQRKEIIDAARRFQGKTQEEQQAEYVKVRPLQRATIRVCARVESVKCRRVRVHVHVCTYSNASEWNWPTRQF